MAWHKATGRRVIIVAGCLGMVFTQLTTSPATTLFVRDLSGSALHVGILNALPSAMLICQWAAAAAVPRLRTRRKLWLAVSLVQRLLLLPVGLGPWLWPQIADAVWLWTFLAVQAVNQGLLQFCTPLWLSWMGDYLPREGLSQYWGTRHRWMQWTAAAALLLAAVLVLQLGLPIRLAFAVLIAIAAAGGVADVLLFLGVHEPPPAVAPALRWPDLLAAPLRDDGFRTFVRYACFWNFAAMLGAPFISLYLLERGLSLFAVMLLWSVSWVGGAALSGRVGQLIDRTGHRPMLILCTALKCSNMLALICLPGDPAWAFWWLVPVFMLDALLNAGLQIANNGFLLRHSPAAHRTSYLAAGTAWAGMVGGLTSVLAGLLLAQVGPRSVQVLFWTWGPYHLAFFCSFLMRLAAVGWAMRIREPTATATRTVLLEALSFTPLRFAWLPAAVPRLTQGLAESSPASGRRAA